MHGVTKLHDEKVQFNHRENHSCSDGVTMRPGIIRIFLCTEFLCCSQDKSTFRVENAIARRVEHKQLIRNRRDLV